MEDDDGFLHSEVGIDKDLERLLAEDPGLYMEDVSNHNNKMNHISNTCPGPSCSPSFETTTVLNPKRYVMHSIGMISKPP